MYQGLVTSSLMPASRELPNLFFGGSGPCSSQGALPFSAAENLLIGAMGVVAGRRSKEEEEETDGVEEEMSNGGSAPLLIYSLREANRRPPRSQVTMVFLHATGTRQVGRLPRQRG